jgi:hypothetical protein
MTALSQAFRDSKTSGVQRMLGNYVAATIGRFILMKMRVVEKNGRYVATHSIFGIPVGVADCFVDAKSRAGDVSDVYYLEFTNRLMRALWCDEMRDYDGGSLVGRIVALPFGKSIPLKYFIYKRIG